MNRILIIEDEELISDLVKINLSLVGYEVYQAFDGMEGLELMQSKDMDLVILDIMLPGIDGYGLLPSIIQRKIPVIFLTSKDSLKDRVRGLDMGADDYVSKPFEAVELIARVKAVLRRAGRDQKSVSFQDIVIYYDQRKVLKSGNEVYLAPREFELLKVLSENRGIALSREKLLQLVWNYDYEGDTRTVDIHIQRLRTKLGTHKIVTVYKLGYRLEV